MPSILSFIFNISNGDGDDSANKLQSCEKVVESPAPTHISDETESVVSLFMGKDSEFVICTPLRNRARLATFMTPNNSNEVVVSETPSSSFTTARFSNEISPPSKSFKRAHKKSPIRILSSRHNQMSTLPQTPKRSCIKMPTKGNHSKKKKQRIRWSDTPEGLKPRRSIEEMRSLFGFPEINSRESHLQTLKKNNLSHQSYPSPSISTIKEEENSHIVTDTIIESPQRCPPTQPKTPNKIERLSPPPMENTPSKSEPLSPPQNRTTFNTSRTASSNRSRREKLPMQQPMSSAANSANSPCLTVENAKTAVGRFVAQSELKKQMHFQCIDDSSIATDGDATWNLDGRYLSMSAMSLLPPGSSNKKKPRCKRKVDTRHMKHDGGKDISVLSASYALLDDSQDHFPHAKEVDEASNNHSEGSSRQSDCDILDNRKSRHGGTMSQDWDFYYERYKDEVYGDENDIILTHNPRREISRQTCDQTPQSYSSRHGLVDEGGRRGMTIPNGSYDFTPLESIEHRYSPKPGSFVIRDENNSWISDISQTTSQGDDLDHSTSFCDIAQRHRNITGTSDHATMHHRIHHQSDIVPCGMSTLSFHPKLNNNSGLTGPSYRRIRNHNHKSSGELCQVRNDQVSDIMIPIQNNQSDLTGPSFHSSRGDYKMHHNSTVTNHTQGQIHKHRGPSLKTLIEQNANVFSDQIRTLNISQPTKKRSYSSHEENKNNTAISGPSFHDDKKGVGDEINSTDTRVNEYGFKTKACENGNGKEHRTLEYLDSPRLAKENESLSMSDESTLQHQRSLLPMTFYEQDREDVSKLTIAELLTNELGKTDTVQKLQTKQTDYNYSGLRKSDNGSSCHDEKLKNLCFNNYMKDVPCRTVHVKEETGRQLEESSMRLSGTMRETPLPSIDDGRNPVGPIYNDESALTGPSVNILHGHTCITQVSKEDHSINEMREDEVKTSEAGLKIENRRQSDLDNQHNIALEVDVEKSTMATMQVVMDMISSKESYQPKNIEQEEERDDISKQLFRDDDKLVTNIAQSSNSSSILSEEMRRRIDLTLQIGLQERSVLTQECTTDQKEEVENDSNFNDRRSV